MRRCEGALHTITRPRKSQNTILTSSLRDCSLLLSAPLNSSTSSTTFSPMACAPTCCHRHDSSDLSNCYAMHALYMPWHTRISYRTALVLWQRAVPPCILRLAPLRQAPLAACSDEEHKDILSRKSAATRVDQHEISWITCPRLSDDIDESYGLCSSPRYVCCSGCI